MRIEMTESFLFNEPASMAADIVLPGIFVHVSLMGNKLRRGFVQKAITTRMPLQNTGRIKIAYRLFQGILYSDGLPAIGHGTNYIF